MATTSKDILKKLHKDYGASIATIGMSSYVDLDRIPTGVFAVDLATGGGLPMGKCVIIYGPESSNKTNLLLTSIREGQIKFPDKKAALVDAEHALDLKWASSLGVDVERLIVLHPEYAEQAVDMIESLLYAEDIFMVALDSLAALTSQKEIENSADVQAVGGASLLIGKLYRKVVVAQNKMANSGITAPCFVAINQIRSKIGNDRGNPETMPGGNPPKFAASMIIRVYGKNIIDKKLHPVLPAYKEVNVILKKWKCPILAVNAVYNMHMLQIGDNGPGFVSDWNTVSKYMQELDYLSKGEKGGWVMNGESYPTLQACKEALYGDKEMLLQMKSTLISDLIEQGGIAPPEEEAAEETEV
jgi:recombination protein RecA